MLSPSPSGWFHDALNPMSHTQAARVSANSWNLAESGLEETKQWVCKKMQMQAWRINILCLLGDSDFSLPPSHLLSLTIGLWVQMEGQGLGHLTVFEKHSNHLCQTQRTQYHSHLTGSWTQQLRQTQMTLLWAKRWPWAPQPEELSAKRVGFP